MRRTARTLATLAALLPLAGCGIGIPETDVIEAGGPATIDVLPARDFRMLLFFLSPDGMLTPVPRVVDDGSARAGGGFREPDGTEEDSGAGDGGSVPLPVRPPTDKTVAALLAGPTATERGAGLSNAPSLPKEARLTVTVSGGVIEAGIDAPLDGMGDLAARQLVCTVAYAEDAWGRPPVRLIGTDGARPSATCDASSVPAPEESDADRPVPTAGAATSPAPGP
ncbi:hypothetical protein [Streptomyces sp. t39]|uniref:hypothetical protein n=1 Tax=Streptomyces sp. t39 TaxID=1828156 RepID=UPI0011CD5A5F|nr:hypothetical protein [Streptomyces sp. t39]TXS54996.1 hypothetical protein EAO77_01335 [Streptomyces sp. t39]